MSYGLEYDFQKPSYEPSWSEVGKAAAISAAPMVLQGLGVGIRALIDKYGVGKKQETDQEKIIKLQNTVNELTMEKAQLIQLIQAQEARIIELEKKLSQK